MQYLVDLEGPFVNYGFSPFCVGWSNFANSTGIANLAFDFPAAGYLGVKSSSCTQVFPQPCWTWDNFRPSIAGNYRLNVWVYIRLGAGEQWSSWPGECWTGSGGSEIACLTDGYITQPVV